MMSKWNAKDVLGMKNMEITDMTWIPLILHMRNDSFNFDE